MIEPTTKQIRPGLYRHFKGGTYYVLSIATDANTGAAMVVYSNPRGLWTRPYEDFTVHVERDGYSGPRFRQEDP